MLTRYHVPRSWFKPSGNILVIFEEKGGDPSKIKFLKRKVTGVCAFIAEDYPVANSEYLQEAGNETTSRNASVHLKCPKNTRISSVKFASFGTPTGACGSYSKGDCHDPNSISLVEKVMTITTVFPCSPLDNSKMNEEHEFIKHAFPCVCNYIIIHNSVTTFNFM